MSLHETLAAAAIAAPSNPRRLFGGVDKAEIAYLRFDDEAAMQAAFAAAGIVPPVVVAQDGSVTMLDGVPLRSWSLMPPNFRWPGVGDVSVLGVIYNDDAVYGEPDESGIPVLITPPTAKAGWHVNVLPELT